MIKKQGFGHEAPFILRVGQEPVQASMPTADQRLQLLASLADSTHFQWATSLKSGRPHQHAAELDTWELELKKGQRVKVLRDLGKDWYLVAGEKNQKGYVHGSWLDFNDHRFHEDPKTAWARFNDATQKILDEGKASEFPCMRSYVDVCTIDGCKAVKDDPLSLGICAHDLMVLLEGSGCYSLEWIKDSRNMWHPDRFTRYCIPEHADGLKVMAQQLFVLYGILMEAL
jgi:methylenetetrahydrofolate dehydrogenase (NADP+)/methenyltetrahydrofolate cyclohydrolase/formyltetrahydrofolate synthetase